MPARRTSNKMKALRGTDTRQRVRVEADYPMVEGYPDAPDWLKGPMAVREWDHKARLLTDAGVLTEASLSTLGHYCNMHAAAVQLWDAGMSPSASDMTQLRLMATEFGFTPASRSKAGGASKPDANPFDALKKSG